MLFHSCLSNLNQNSNFELKCQERHFANMSFSPKLIDLIVSWLMYVRRPKVCRQNGFRRKDMEPFRYRKVLFKGDHRQTSANRTKQWPSFQHYVCVNVVHFLCYEVKLPKLKLKTQPKQFLGSLPLDIALPRMRQLTHRLVAILLLLVSPTSCQIDDALKASCWLAGWF